MTAESSQNVNGIVNFCKICASEKSPRCRHAGFLGAMRQSQKARRAAATANARLTTERPSQRLRKILLTNPRARHFSVQRIISSLGEDPHGPTLALFSAAGVFAAPDVAHLSGVMTGALGAQLVLRRQVQLPRALLRTKIPRNSLAPLINATANLLEKAEAVVHERWSWVFSPAMGVGLGLILFLLGVASMTPFLGMTMNHAASGFIMSVGLAERDGLVVMIATLAGIASLAFAVASTLSGKQIWTTTRDWLLKILKRLRLHIAAWFLDRIERGLGDLVRITWSDATMTFFADFAGPKLEPAAPGDRADRSLKARAQRIRLAVSRRVDEGRR
jgi:hypothetical protein